ncbi:hypothetical protein [Dictyobacter kobayashii]
MFDLLLAMKQAADRWRLQGASAVPTPNGSSGLPSILPFWPLALPRMPLKPLPQEVCSPNDKDAKNRKPPRICSMRS